MHRLQKPFSVTRIFALSDQAVEWCTCGISRMYYTILENDIASKDMAAEYGLAHSPPNTHRILKEALHIRNGKETIRIRIVRKNGALWVPGSREANNGMERLEPTAAGFFYFQNFCLSYLFGKKELLCQHPK